MSTTDAQPPVRQEDGLREKIAQLEAANAQLFQIGEKQYAEISHLKAMVRGEALPALVAKWQRWIEGDPKDDQDGGYQIGVQCCIDDIAALPATGAPVPAGWKLSDDDREFIQGRLHELDENDGSLIGTFGVERRMADLLRALLSASPAPPSEGWRVVTDTLPTGGYMLVWPTVQGVPEVWAAETFHKSLSAAPGPGWTHLVESAKRITHWMPLPAPPLSGGA